MIRARGHLKFVKPAPRSGIACLVRTDCKHLLRQGGRPPLEMLNEIISCDWASAEAKQAGPFLI
jgi:hypothetical protein